MTDPTAPCPVCRADVATIDGLLITHRHRDQFGPCPAGQVEAAIAGDALAEAEREFRQAVPNSWGDTEVPDWALVRLLAEYDRMRAELTKTVADCGICTLGARTIHINDDCPRHSEGDGW